MKVFFLGVNSFNLELKINDKIQKLIKDASEKNKILAMFATIYTYINF